MEGRSGKLSLLLSVFRSLLFSSPFSSFSLVRFSPFFPFFLFFFLVCYTFASSSSYSSSPYRFSIFSSSHLSLFLVLFLHHISITVTPPRSPPPTLPLLSPPLFSLPLMLFSLDNITAITIIPPRPPPPPLPLLSSSPSSPSPPPPPRVGLLPLLIILSRSLCIQEPRNSPVSTSKDSKQEKHVHGTR